MWILLLMYICVAFMWIPEAVVNLLLAETAVRYLSATLLPAQEILKEFLDLTN